MSYPQEQDLYRLLFESNPQSMWVYDLATLRFLAVNDAAVHHYGYSRAEFLRMTLKDIRPQEDVKLLENYIAAQSDEIYKAGEWRHRKKDGTLINVEITAHKLNFAGRPAASIAAFINWYMPARDIGLPSFRPMSDSPLAG